MEECTGIVMGTDMGIATGTTMATVTAIITITTKSRKKSKMIQILTEKSEQASVAIQRN